MDLKQLNLLKLTNPWQWIIVVLVMISLLMTPPNTVANVQTVTNISDLQKLIQVNLTNRETNFTLNFSGDTTHMMDNLETVFTQARQTDDYLNTSLTSWEYKVSGTTKKATLEFIVGYLTTKAQEDYIDASVQTLVPTLISSDMSDVAKEKAFHDWLIKNVAYDYTLSQRTAYTALTTGKTVCTGYTMLMNKMLSQAGIKSYIIAGYLSETGSSIPNTERENHVWNLVQVDNQWYHLDVTNDWNNPDSYMFFNKGSQFMKEKGFTWHEDQLTKPVTVESPEQSVNAPIVTEPAVSNLPFYSSESVTMAIDFLDNTVTTFTVWMTSVIQQFSLIISDLLYT